MVCGACCLRPEPLHRTHTVLLNYSYCTTGKRKERICGCPFFPSLASALILTHIFGGLLAERGNTVETVKHSPTAPRFCGRFTKFICKMWVRIRAEAKESPERKFLWNIRFTCSENNGPGRQNGARGRQIIKLVQPLVSARSVLSRSAPLRSALPRFVSMRTALLRFAPLRSVSPRFAPLRSVSLRLAT